MKRPKRLPGRPAVAPEAQHVRICLSLPPAVAAAFREEARKHRWGLSELFVELWRTRIIPLRKTPTAV